MLRCVVYAQKMCQQLVSQALGASITSQQRLQRRLAGKAIEARARAQREKSCDETAAQPQMRSLLDRVLTARFA